MRHDMSNFTGSELPYTVIVGSTMVTAQRVQ
ncbi:unnamed protein product, partial [Adineta steineri]